MEVSTPKEFLDKVLPEKFDPEKAAGLAAVVQFKISGDDGGEWVLTIKDGKIEVTDGNATGNPAGLCQKTLRISVSIGSLDAAQPHLANAQRGSTCLVSQEEIVPDGIDTRQHVEDVRGYGHVLDRMNDLTILDPQALRPT